MGHDKAPTAANPAGDLTGFACPRTRWCPINDPRFTNIIVRDGRYRGRCCFNRHMQQRVDHNERFIMRDFFLRL